MSRSGSRSRCRALRLRLRFRGLLPRGGGRRFPGAFAFGLRPRRPLSVKFGVFPLPLYLGSVLSHQGFAFGGISLLCGERIQLLQCFGRERGFGTPDRDFG